MFLLSILLIAKSHPNTTNPYGCHPGHKFPYHCHTEANIDYQKTLINQACSQGTSKITEKFLNFYDTTKSYSTTHGKEYCEKTKKRCLDIHSYNREKYKIETENCNAIRIYKNFKYEYTLTDYEKAKKILEKDEKVRLTPKYITLQPEEDIKTWIKKLSEYEKELRHPYDFNVALINKNTIVIFKSDYYGIAEEIEVYSITTNIKEDLKNVKYGVIEENRNKMERGVNWYILSWREHNGNLRAEHVYSEIKYCKPCYTFKTEATDKKYIPLEDLIRQKQEN